MKEETRQSQRLTSEVVSAPQRTCVGCGAKRSKQALIRLVLSDEGQPQVDAAQRAPGRGAYLCGAGCLKAAAKRKAFQRAFRGAMKDAALDILGQSLQQSFPEGWNHHVEKARS